MSRRWKSWTPSTWPCRTPRFDVVVAQYVVTAIPNPEQALDEFVRVVRPGGEIILTTRIGAETGLRGTLEKWLMPLTSRLGWRTEFPWSRYELWADGDRRGSPAGAARAAAAGPFLAVALRPRGRSCCVTSYRALSRCWHISKEHR